MGRGGLQRRALQDEQICRDGIARGWWRRIVPLVLARHQSPRALRTVGTEWRPVVARSPTRVGWTPPPCPPSTR